MLERERVSDALRVAYVHDGLRRGIRMARCHGSGRGMAIGQLRIEISNHFTYLKIGSRQNSYFKLFR